MNCLCIEEMRDPMTVVISYLGGGRGDDEEEDPIVDYQRVRTTCRFLLKCWEHAWFLEVPLQGVHVTSATAADETGIPFPWITRLIQPPSDKVEDAH